MVQRGRCTQTMIVSAEALADAPDDFKHYVKKHFRKSSILGQDCWAAVLHDDNSDMKLACSRKGDAPHPSGENRWHNVPFEGLDRYTLLDWVNAQVGKTIWLVVGSYSEFPTRHAPSGEDWDDE